MTPRLVGSFFVVRTKCLEVILRLEDVFSVSPPPRIFLLYPLNAP
ncbi:hypothetical protein [Helicobacter japonicus]|nr:hypothetical protein [Helicobacter japonicus]